RCLFHTNSILFNNRQDACSTQTQFYSTTGKMPVPHKLNFIQQQARCLFHTNSILLWNGQDACSTQTQFYSTTGKMPVPHKLNFIVERAEEPVSKQI
ncbi:hypothetical protein QUA05_17720, partial [Microcoleus sp. SVA1_A1]